MRVLVVDDEPGIREMLSFVFRFEGFDVDVAADGREAIEQASRHRPDVVVLDVMMPELDGWEVAARLRADPELAEVPIVFCTAMKGDAQTWRGWQLGAASYVAKPFDNEALLAEVVKAVHEPAVTG